MGCLSRVVWRKMTTRYQGCTVPCLILSWWRHQMATFSALLARCARNSPVTGEFSAQRPMTWSFDVFFDLSLNNRLSKQSWGWWFEMPLHSLWRHCNACNPLLYQMINTLRPEWNRQHFAGDNLKCNCWIEITIIYSYHYHKFTGVCPHRFNWQYMSALVQLMT